MTDTTPQHMSMDEIRANERTSPKTLRDAGRGPEALGGTHGADGEAATPSEDSADGNRRTNR